VLWVTPHTSLKLPGRTANSQGRTSTGKSHSIHGMRTLHPLSPCASAHPQWGTAPTMPSPAVSVGSFATADCGMGRARRPHEAQESQRSVGSRQHEEPEGGDAVPTNRLVGRGVPRAAHWLPTALAEPLVPAFAPCRDASERSRDAQPSQASHQAPGTTQSGVRVPRSVTGAQPRGPSAC